MTDQQDIYYEEYRHTGTVGGPLTDAERDLLNLLARCGRMTKREIVTTLGWDERKVRKAAETLKRRGIPVMASSGTGAGYWLSTDLDEIEVYVSHELESRIASLTEQAAALSLMVGAVRARMAAQIRMTL